MAFFVFRGLYKACRPAVPNIFNSFAARFSFCAAFCASVSFVPFFGPLNPKPKKLAKLLECLNLQHF